MNLITDAYGMKPSHEQDFSIYISISLYLYICINALCFYALSQAYERRFPTCPLIPIFVHSDIISERQSEDGATCVIERRCTIDVEAPRLLKRVILFQKSKLTNYKLQCNMRQLYIKPILPI